LRASDPRFARDDDLPERAWGISHRGGDISGFPAFLGEIGHGVILGIPVPMLVFAVAAILWHAARAHSSRLRGGDDRLNPRAS
jgi:hypothetical protein